MHGRVLTLLLLSVMFVGTPVDEADAVELGEPAGEISLLDVRNERLKVQATGQQPAVALLFLSARSEAVEKSIAEINQLYRKHRRLKVLYIGVCSNSVESADELGAFARTQGSIFTIYRDPEGTTAKRLGIKTIPSVALLDDRGKLIHRGGLESESGRLAFDAAVMSKTAPRSESRVDVAPTPIDQPGQPRQQMSPFGSLSYSSELVFERIPEAVVYHCSTIAEAGNGDLLCLWYGGSYESADDQALFLARRLKGQRAWEAPQVLIRGPKPLPGNGVVFVDGEKRVWIVWSRMESTRPIGRGQGWNECRLMFRTSGDHGITWTPDAEFLQADIRGVPRNPPVRRANGDLVLPVEGAEGGVEGSTFLIGSALGTQWRKGGFTAGGSQPAVVERKDGTLFALMRKAPRLTQIESSDGGETWSEATESTLRNPDSGITMTKLASGNLVVVFNDSDRMRTPLSIARSIDEGRSWETPLQLESNPGEYSYPCAIQTADKKIHVTYTYRRYSIKHVEFNEDWLVHFERPN
ncbi:MAG: exo-alpha-sialidase [Planctomycetaceae bacterium]